MDSVEEREKKQDKKVKVRRGPLRQKKKLSRKVQQNAAKLQIWGRDMVNV